MNSDDDTIPLIIPDSDTEYNEDEHFVIYKPLDNTPLVDSADSISEDSEVFFFHDIESDTGNENVQDSQAFFKNLPMFTDNILKDRDATTQIEKDPHMSKDLINNIRVANDHVSPDLAEQLDLSNLYHGMGQSRTLRKRKAIQKMPYSLDRLKHRQQLQGFDVSNFDSVSEKVKLPNHPIEADSQERQIEQLNAKIENYTQDPNSSDNNSYYTDSDLESSSSKDGKEPIVNGTTHHNFVQEENTTQEIQKPLDIQESKNDHFEIREDTPATDTENSDDSQEDQHIIFRGRKIDMKRGFRGILPRIAWEKSLKEKKSSKKRKKVVLDHTQKGVAKKKKMSLGLNNDDKDLMKELIVPDNTIEYDDQDIIDSGLGREGINTEGQYQIIDKINLNDFDDVETYLDKRYKNYYSSEDENHDAVLPTFAYETNDDQHFKYSELSSPSRNITDLIKSKDLHELSEKHTSLLGTNTTGFAEEYNGKVIDLMLSKRSNRSFKKKLNKSQRKRKRVRNVKINIFNKSNTVESLNASEKKVAKQTIGSRNKEKNIDFQGSNRDSNNTSRKEFHKTGTTNGSKYVLEDQITIESSDEENELSTKSKKTKQKGKKKYYGVPVANNDINFRRANVFTTVLEGLSNKYSLKKKGIVGGNLNDEIKVLENNNSTDEIKKLIVVEALFMNKYIEVRDIQKVIISQKTFLLSKLSLSEVPSALNNIFTEIVDHGVTDTELVTVCQQVTEFLYFLNQPNIYYIIEKFHKSFRDKVFTMGNRTKPIHFYQIVICQLMFYEISKYSDISSSFRNEIEFKILDHISSFFSLLSKCFSNEFTRNSAFMAYSFEILHLIIQKMKNTDQLWSRLKNHRFKPDICLLISNLFPTREINWSILQIDNNYLSVSEALNFINFAVSDLHWTLSDDLVLFLNTIYKKRRFRDFNEEATLSFKTQVTSNFEYTLEKSTLFSIYLNLLYKSALSDATIEKIIPLGEVSCVDPYSILVNRINLLLVLSKKSSYTLEKRFDLLLKSIILDPKIDNLNTVELQRITTLVLNAQVNIFETNRSRKIPYKSRIMIDIYEKLINTHQSLWNIWYLYLREISEIIEQNTHNDVTILKNLYKCLVPMILDHNLITHSKLLSSILVLNIEKLGPSWTKTHLFQSVKSVLKQDKSWIDSYCVIGNYLIRNGELSWWSFFIYNNLDDSIDDKIYFFGKVIVMCDDEAFNMIKQYMYETTIELLFTRNDSLFENFVESLLNRDNIVEYLHIDNSIENKKLQNCKRLLGALVLLSDKNLIDRLIKKIQKLYLDKSFPLSFFSELINFLNSKYIDVVKYNNIFIILKRELGISDVEFEKSSFRDTVKNLPDEGKRTIFIENYLIQSLSVLGEVNVLTEKLLSLLSDSSIGNITELFCNMITCHINISSLNDSPFPLIISTYMLHVLNTHIENIFYQITDQEFRAAYHLIQHTCVKFFDFEYDLYGDNFLEEISRLLLNTLNVTEGFKEHKIICNIGRVIIFKEISSFQLNSTDIPTDMQQNIRQIINNNKNNLEQTTFYSHKADAAYTNKLKSLLSL